MQNHGFHFQTKFDDRNKITWLVSVTVKNNRDEVLKLLKTNGIDARPFFFSLSDMDIYKEYSHNENVVSKKISATGMNLPTYGNLNNLNKIDQTLSEVDLAILKLSS